jgi:hypothetical protein
MLVRRGVAVAGGLVAAVFLLAGAAAFACTNLATLSLSSNAGKSGDVVTVTGSSYRMPSGVTTGVQLRWNALDGPVLAEAVPDKVGNISASITIPQAAPDTYVVIAVLKDARGNDTSGTPSRAQFQVVGGAGAAAPQPAIAQQTPVASTASSGSAAPLALLLGLGALGLLLFGGGIAATARGTRTRTVPAPAKTTRD